MSERTNDFKTMLLRAGLRPTPRRIALAKILFTDGDRHVSAESLHNEALGAGVCISLATIYNTLKQFSECGLLREIAFDSTKRFFDTRTSDHQHLYFEDGQQLVDIAPGVLSLSNIPSPPDGTEVIGADIIVRVKAFQN